MDVCNDLLALANKEAEALKNAAPFPAAEIQAERKVLLKRLDSALTRMTQQRPAYGQLRTEPRGSNAQCAPLLKSAMDTIMRILVLDRENEQALLRRGLLPLRSLPPAAQSQPSYIARTYQRHG